MRHTRAFLIAASFAVLLQTPAAAATIVSQVGTPAATGTDYNSLGATLSGLMLSAGQGTPGLGNGWLQQDLAPGHPFTWTHSYGAISGSITSATLTVDIIDADTGNGIGLFDLHAGSNAGLLIGMMSGNNNGDPGPWEGLGSPGDPDNVFSLSPLLFPMLSTGTFAIFGVPEDVGYFGMNRSLLTIETSSGPTTVPEPGSVLLLGSGILGLGWLVRRRR